MFDLGLFGLFYVYLMYLSTESDGIMDEYDKIV